MSEVTELKIPFMELLFVGLSTTGLIFELLAQETVYFSHSSFEPIRIKK
jgi:hypothetical protein